MIIFNGIESIGYDRNFEFVGSNFNYRNVDTIVLNGRFVFTAEGEYDSLYGAGFSFVSGSGVWTSLPDANFEIQYETGAESGLFSIDGQNAYIDFGDGGAIAEQGYTSLNVSSIWEDMDSIIDHFQDYNEIIIKGVSLGSGIVKNINFPSSQDTTNRNFSVTIEMPKSGDFNTIQGLGSDGLVLDGEELRHVNSISENFSFNRGSDEQIEMNRSLNISLTSGYEMDPVATAKSIAQGFINNVDPVFQIFAYPDFYLDYDKRYQESYDVIRGEYSWSESIIKSNNNDYHWTYGHSLTQTENGIYNVEENGEVIGRFSNRYESALNGWNSIKNQIKNRSTSFYQEYTTGDGSLNLSNSSVTRNEVEGVISYNYAYTDDPSQNECVRFSRTTDISVGQNNLYTASENGEVIGKCGDSYTERFKTATGFFFSQVEPGIKQRLSNIFNSVRDGSCAEELNLSSQERTYRRKESAISYNYVYDNRNNLYDDESFRVEKSVSIEDTVPTVQFFLTPYNGEIAQYQEQSEMIKESQTITVLGKSNSLSLNDYLTKAQNCLTEPDTPVFYIDNNQYGFNPKDRKLDLSVSYKYTGVRSRNDSDV